jgi:hypothetical protein
MKIGGAPSFLLSFYTWMVFDLSHLLQLGHQLLLLPKVGLHTGLRTGSAGGLGSLNSRSEMRFGGAPAILFLFTT